MNKLIVVILLFSTSTAFADWRMDRFDLDGDGTIIKREISLAGCKIKTGHFEHADKNNDGKLTLKESRDATAYLFNKRRCPIIEIRG